tara:strand:+ start:668 stop:1894 length:1227 start_codon:yes stop_codon:yes gene_type:complete
MTRLYLLAFIAFALPVSNVFSQSAPSTQQLANWIKRFPEADVNKDGTLTAEEAIAYKDNVLAKRQTKNSTSSKAKGAPSTFSVDPAWDGPTFPKHSVFLKSPEEIKAIYQSTLKNNKPAVVSFDQPTNGALRIVGTGHSFMAPGYRTLPHICEASGFTQPLHTHTGGGITGSTRYKWEQENGIFQFDGKPLPKLLSSIANADWDAMMWGPYFNDRPQYYACWIDFCHQYHPEMKFYLSDAWIQLFQLGENPKSESFFTDEELDRLNHERSEGYTNLVTTLRQDYPDKVFIMPTSNAMTIAAKHFIRGKLPGIEGLHKVIGGKDRSLWKDQLGHLGPGFDRLEGYVFYATLYGKSPELIETKINFDGKSDFPSPALDKVFRKIAWQAVIDHPLSGVTDQDGDGVNDSAQ